MFYSQFFFLPLADFNTASDENLGEAQEAGLGMRVYLGLVCLV